MKLKVSKETIIRLAILLLTLINTVAVMAGFSPIDLTDAVVTETVEAVYTAVSYLILVVSTLWAAWKNNSITQPALKADIYLEEQKTFDAEQLK